MKNALIINSVMVNNGDAGLVVNLFKALQKNKFSTTIATHNYQFSLKNYESLKFCRDILSIPVLGPKKIFSPILIPILMILNKNYRSADILIGAPGGYINSYYGFRWKLYVFKWAKYFGKQTMLYSQSIGPLTEKDNVILREYSKYIDLIIVRDELSYEYAQKAGVPINRLLLSEDAIFLQAPKAISEQEGDKKRACISVRSWQHDDRNIEQYFEMIQLFISILINNGYTVDLLSTCQGISGYIDDSAISTQITKSIDKDNRKNVNVIEKYFNVFDLQHEIENYNLVIGTRLHMCLLGILNGVPAFNISYETKGKECYKYLDAEQYSVDYNENLDEAAKKLHYFLSNLESIKTHLTNEANKKHGNAIITFKKAFEKMEKI